MYLRIIFSLVGCLFLFNGLVDYYLHRFYLQPLRSRTAVGLHWLVSALFVVGVGVISYRFAAEVGKLHQMMWFMFAYFMVYIPKLTFALFSLPALRFRAAARAVNGVAGGVSLFVLGAFLYGFTVGRTTPRVEEVELIVPRLPEAFEGLRVVHLSDIHLGNLGERSALMQEVVAITQSLRPDLICFSGDLVNSRSEELASFEPLLATLTAPFGVFAVLGNHDYSDYARFSSKEEKQDNFNQLLVGIDRIGWQLLNNRAVTLYRGVDSMVVVGVENWGEPPFPRHGDLDQALKGLDDRTFKILLSHNPEHWRKVVTHNPTIDLTLSGHTHAMQFKIDIGGWRWSAAQYKYPTWSGLYSGLNNHLYVNDGIGYVFIPFRLGTQPEITLITLRRK